MFSYNNNIQGKEEKFNEKKVIQSKIEKIEYVLYKINIIMKIFKKN